MKLLIGILILVELLLILGVICPVLVDRKDHARAVDAYINAPNPITITHHTTTVVDYLYVRAKTKRGWKKTYTFGLYSPENLTLLQDFLRKVKGNKP